MSIWFKKTNFQNEKRTFAFLFWHRVWVCAVSNLITANMTSNLILLSKIFAKLNVNLIEWSESFTQDQKSMFAFLLWHKFSSLLLWHRVWSLFLWHRFRTLLFENKVRTCVVSSFDNCKNDFKLDLINLLCEIECQSNKIKRASHRDRKSTSAFYLDVES